MRELAARPAEARERALSRCQLLEPHLEGGVAAYGRDGSEVCFRTSQRLIVHPRPDATNSGKRSTTNNVTSYTLRFRRHRLIDHRWKRNEFRCSALRAPSG